MDCGIWLDLATVLKDKFIQIKVYLNQSRQWEKTFRKCRESFKEIDFYMYIFYMHYLQGNHVQVFLMYYHPNGKKLSP